MTAFDPGAVPPADDFDADPAEVELQQWLKAARALIDGLRPATAANAGRFLEPDAVAAAALLREHEPAYFDQLREELRAARKGFLRGWDKALKGAKDAADKAAEAAAQAALVSVLEEMNRKYAVVTLGGSVKVVELDVLDPCLNRKHLRIMAKADFDLALANRRVEVAPGLFVRLATWWIGHPKRRQHLGGVTLDPSRSAGPEFLNTWHGFGVEPCAGDPGIFTDHVEMICAGNGEGAAEYVINWLATKMQRPGEQMEVALVLRGGEGTGKGALGHTYVALLGGHALHVSQPEHLVGKFNAHLMDCLGLFADEAFFAGNPRHASVLKALITERLITIEPKFVNAYQAPNRLGIVMASNADFVVPAGRDARRFCCIDVPDTRKTDHAYFKRYFDAKDDPAQLGAFLKFLRERDLSGFQIRNFPSTAMLTEQKVATLGEPEKWLLNRLALGRMGELGAPIFGGNGRDKIIVGYEWPDWASTAQLYGDYMTELRCNGQPRFALDVTRFGQFMGRYFSASRPRQNGGKRPPGYKLGPLPQAREVFERYHRLEGVWGDDGDDG